MKNRKKKLLREKKNEIISMFLCGLIFIVIGILVLLGKVDVKGQRDIIAGVVILILGIGGIVWGFLSFKKANKTRTSVLYILEEDVVDNIKSNLDLFGVEYTNIESNFDSYISIDIVYKNNIFCIFVDEKEVTMMIDYFLDYLDELDEEEENNLKDYSEYEETYSALNMTKEQFVTKVIGYVNKYKDFL